MGLRPLLRLSVLLLAGLAGACSGGSATADLPDLNLPAGLENGDALESAAADQAFRDWAGQLPAEPTIPLSVSYQLDAGFTLRSADEGPLEGSAVGTFDFLFHDRERARADTFLVLALPDQPEPWQLTGTLQFDGFYLRAWGTGNHVPKVDPERIYASQFEQSVLESTYASLTRLMPKLLGALDDRGIPGGALLDRGAEDSPLFLMHPRGLLELTKTAFHCTVLRHDADGLHASFSVDVREGSPLRPMLASVLDVPEEMLEMVASNFQVDTVLEARTGMILGVSFVASVTPSPLQPEWPDADLHFRLTADDLAWKVASLDDVLDRPEGMTPIDLTAMLQVADKFLRERGDALEAEEDYDLDD